MASGCARLQRLDGRDGAGVAAQHERVEQLGVHVAQRGRHDRAARRRRCALAAQRLQHVAQPAQQALRAKIGSTAAVSALLCYSLQHVSARPAGPEPDQAAHSPGQHPCRAASPARCSARPAGPVAAPDEVANLVSSSVSACCHGGAAGNEMTQGQGALQESAGQHKKGLLGVSIGFLPWGRGLRARAFQGELMMASKERAPPAAPPSSPGPPRPLPGLPGRLAVAARASRLASSDSSTPTCAHAQCTTPVVNTSNIL
jgi:hypothetical protein